MNLLIIVAAILLSILCLQMSLSSAASSGGAVASSLIKGVASAGVCTASKAVKEVLQNTGYHWVGDAFFVKPVFANKAFTADLSPFLMFDYGAPKDFPAPKKGEKPARKGVGEHPHRGFETVTIAFQGEVEHGDSVGNRGVIKPGDVQWMTAGRGIIHEEFLSTEFTARGGLLEMCQLWVNLPKEHKMTAPKYQGIEAATIPTVSLADTGDVRVIAGEFNGTKGPATTFTPINVLDITLRKDKTMILDIESGHNSIVFVRKGSVSLPLSKTRLGNTQVAIMARDGQSIEIENTSSEDSSILLLSGLPLNEPIANQGPFVMNTRDELRQAIIDYQSGNFGS